VLHLEHAGNEKEFMPEFKCMCAERELVMSTVIWIVVIIMKNTFAPSFISFLPQSVIGVDNTAYQRRKKDLFANKRLEGKKYTTGVT
jgi:hypothetical protein